MKSQAIDFNTSEISAWPPGANACKNANVADACVHRHRFCEHMECNQRSAIKETMRIIHQAIMQMNLPSFRSFLFVLRPAAADFEFLHVVEVNAVGVPGDLYFTAVDGALQGLLSTSACAMRTRTNCGRQFARARAFA